MPMIKKSYLALARHPLEYRALRRGLRTSLGWEYWKKGYNYRGTCKVLDRTFWSPDSCGHAPHTTEPRDINLILFFTKTTMLLQETILCATSPTATNAGPGLIAIHDIQTGGTLTSFKQTNASTHSTAVFQSKDTQGGFILASQPDKSILNVYNFQKVSLQMSSFNLLLLIIQVRIKLV